LGCQWKDTLGNKIVIIKDLAETGEENKEKVLKIHGPSVVRGGSSNHNHHYDKKRNRNNKKNSMQDEEPEEKIF
jgi:hypothetical protein